MGVTNNLELTCPNCGPIYFELEWPESFYVKWHLCDWDEPKPNYKTDISDVEMLAACRDFHAHVNDTPDKALSKKYSQAAICGKMEELDHRQLIDWGVSL